MGKIQKSINKLYKIYSKCTNCKRARGLKRYYENKGKLSNEQKMYYEKTREFFFPKLKQ